MLKQSAAPTMILWYDKDILLKLAEAIISQEMLDIYEVDSRI
jgi:hypothetical protein